MKTFITALTITMTACAFSGCATEYYVLTGGDLVTGMGVDGDTELVMSPFCKSLRAGNRILEEKDWRNWDVAPIYAPDGSVHLFVGRWPVKGSWLKNAQIDHYKAEKPEGPYQHVETVFAKESVTYFNPQINKVDDLYVMVYSFKEARTPGVQQQIGLATSKSLNGPWKESPHNPIIHPSLKPGTANCLHASNATFVHAPDGKYRIYYKSMSDKYPKPYMRAISMAVAENIEGPYENYSGNPLISYADHGIDIEDPYAFYYEGKYYMILEDRMGVAGLLTGKKKPKVIKKGGSRHGLIYKSEDGISWGRPEVGYQSNSFYFQEKTQRFERPHILWKNGEPDYLFLALNKGKYNTSSGAVLRIERQNRKECQSQQCLLENLVNEF